MSERFNFPSNNSMDHDDDYTTRANGNGTAPLSNGNGNGNSNRPHPLAGRYSTSGPSNGSANGRRDNGTDRLNNPATEQTNSNIPEIIRPNGVVGQRVLNGALAAFSPSSLLSLLSIQKQTGWLYMRSGSLSGYIYVDKGEVFDAGIGAVSSGALAVFQLFGWKQGDFLFETGAPAAERRTIEVSLPVLQVRATLWLDNMNKYIQYVPSPSYLVSVAAEQRSEVVIEQYQWPVLMKIVSHPVSVAELALELGQDLMTVTRITTELVKMGVAVVKPPEA